MSTSTSALLLIVALIAVNGVFVAAEFALVTVPRSQVDDQERQGSRRARIVQNELSELSYALSVAQFGITVSSLLVGYLADRAIGDTIVAPLLRAIGLPDSQTLPISLFIALLIPTVVQVVIGELVPKNLAIARPLSIALTLTPFTRVFGRVLRPLIRVLDRSAVVVARKVFGVHTVDELERGRTLDEIARIVVASSAEGSLSEGQAALAGRAVDLGRTRVMEVMVPRPDVYTLRVDDTLDGLRDAARTSGHSRFPVRDTSSDGFVGTVHVKDLLRVPANEHAHTTLGTVMTDVLSVPETAQLGQLLAALRREQRTFALVIDEHGSTAGIVTIEDVIERLVGDVTDEFDRSRRGIRRAGVDRFLVPGSFRIEQLATSTGIQIEEGPYETVAGFVLDVLGHIPEPGETVRLPEATFEVIAVDGVRITEVRMTRHTSDQ